MWRAAARLWNTRALAGGAGGEAAGALSAGEHGAAILDAAFSPDGSALATASADGYVMFFQVRFTRSLTLNTDASGDVRAD